MQSRRKVRCTVSLENVQIGDVLINEHGRGSRAVVRVTHATATLIYVRNGKYRRKDGYQCGERGWSSWTVRLPRQGELEELRQLAVANKIRMSIRDMRLEKIVKALGELLGDVRDRLLEVEEQDNDANA